MSNPVRLQRRRTKGFKLESPNGLPIVYVGRPTKWGNPLKLSGDMIYIDASHRRTILDKWVYLCQGDSKKVVELYRVLLSKSDNFQDEPDIEFWIDHFMEIDVKELKGKNLACFCPIDCQCHADVLLDIANSE